MHAKAFHGFGGGWTASGVDKGDEARESSEEAVPGIWAFWAEEEEEVTFFDEFIEFGIVNDDVFVLSGGAAAKDEDEENDF